MKKQAPYTLLILILLICSYSAQAKKNSSKDKTPTKKFIIGSSNGGLNVSGDIRSKNLFNLPKQRKNTIGFGLLVQMSIYKNLIYAELNYIQGKAHGYNYASSKGYVNANSTNPWVRAGYTNGVFYNYLTNLKMANIGAVVTSNKNRRLSVNLGVGLGFVAYSTWTDALNSRGNRYENGFEAINQKVYPGGIKAYSTDLNNLFDGEYESPAERHNPNNDVTLTPSGTLSIGTTINLSSNLSLELRNKVFITGDDLIDGQRWQERSSITQDADNVNYLSIGLRYAW